MVKCATSNVNGIYSVTGLGSGTYSLNISRNGITSIPTPSVFSINNIVTGLLVTTDKTQDFVLPLVALSGKTTDNSGTAVPSVPISISSASWSAGGASYTVNSQSFTSGIDGNYSFALLSYNGYIATLTPAVGSAYAVTTISPLDVTTSRTRDLQLNPAFNISGTVRNPAGTVISNISVCSTGTMAKCATSNASGMYSITGLGSGTYSLNISRNGATSIPTPSAFSINNIVTGIAVNADKTQDITLPLVTLNGKTTGSGGAAVSSVLISIPLASWSAGTVAYSVSSQNFTTGIDGNYSFALLSYSRYSTTLTPAAGSGYTLTTISPLDVTTSTTRDLQLIAGITLSGIVKNQAGDGISNISVCSTGTIAKCAISNATGIYSITGLGSGTYGLNISRSGVTSIPTPSGFSINNIATGMALTADKIQDITVPLVTLSGKSTGNNGVAVSAVPISIPLASWSVGSVAYSVSGQNFTSDAGGNYSFNLLSYSAYSATLTPVAGSGYIATTISPLDVTTSATRNLQLNPAFTISGTVRNPAGTVISNISVCSTGTMAKCAISNASGMYSITGLGSGTYGLSISRNGATSIPTPSVFSINNIVTGIAVTADKTQDITLPLVTLNGKTTGNSGAAVSGVLISIPLASWSAGTVAYSVSSQNFTTGIDGNYSFTLLSYNGYSANLTPATGSAYAVTTISPLDLTTSITRDLQLNPGFAISGTVRNPTGTVISNIKVCTNETPPKCATSDASGMYRITNINSGIYGINISRISGMPVTNIPTPTIFSVNNIISSLLVDRDKTMDIAVPLVTMSGKTTDNNGIAVSNVTISTLAASWSVGSVTFSLSIQSCSSDATNGSYSITLLPYGNYSFTINPNDSNFLSNTITSYILQTDKQQNIILNKSIPEFLVSLDIKGAGGGSVNSDPPGIHCIGGSCLWYFATNLTLTAVPDRISEFSGWSGACSGTSRVCSITLDTNKSVTATFGILNRVKLIRSNVETYLDNLITAVSTATDGDIFFSQTGDYAGDIIFNKPANISLVGGMDGNFNPTVDMSRIQGKLVIQTGRVTIKNISIF